MNYITHSTGEGITLYFDGEKFQQHPANAKRYEMEEAFQAIADFELIHADITPIDEGWRQVNDAAFNMIKGL